MNTCKQAIAEEFGLEEAELQTNNLAPMWQNIEPDEWNDWKWQLKNRITTADVLKKIIELTPGEEEAIEQTKKAFPMAITPYFSLFIEKDDPEGPIRKQVVPTLKEFNVSRFDLVDPCGEDEDSPVPGLVHRYPDRVLLLVTEQCASYCRYCTRKRTVGIKEATLSKERLRKIFAYIKANPAVRDVLISGGDPLLLSDDKLQWILSKLRSIPTVEIVRIGTRLPVYLPQRINKELITMLREFHPLWINIHFSHPAEITQEVKNACRMLVDGGIPLGSQTVLLRGINDDSSTIKTLVHELVKMRIRPYYLYQCDLAIGTEHFRTRVAVGIEIMEDLQGYTSGYAVPTFVIDAPQGGGKVPIAPIYMISQSRNCVSIRNYQGELYRYWEPDDRAQGEK